MAATLAPSYRKVPVTRIGDLEASVTKITVEVENNNVEKAIREWKK